MGGDEFVVLLPGVDPEDVDATSSRISVSVVREVGRELFAGRHANGQRRRSATFPADGNDAEQLLAEADRRMYKEKRAHKQAASAVFDASRNKDNKEWAATVH